MGKIVVLGSFINDLVVNVKDFPKPGESIISQQFHSFLGGKGINQSVAISRLGGEVEMIGMLGDDNYGKYFLSLLKEENIDHQKVFISKKTSTGISQVQINQKGQNQICVYLGANLDLDLSYLNKIKESIDQCHLFLCQFEMREDITFASIIYAKEKGKIVIVNPAPARDIPDDVLACIDYLTPNETELAKIANMEEVNSEEQIKEACQKIIQKGAKNIIVTLGEKGCYLYNKNQAILYPGFKVKAVDTVAAGDSFNAALAVKINENAPIEEAIRYANGMGALTVQTLGAISSLKTRVELEEFLRVNS